MNIQKLSANLKSTREPQKERERDDDEGEQILNNEPLSTLLIRDKLLLKFNGLKNGP